MQPDIEIYLLACPNEDIMNWLKIHFIILGEKRLNSDLLAIDLEINKVKIKAQILERAVGKRFTSVWFDSDKTPWSSDVECARDAYAVLKCEIRCNMASWQESNEEDPDQWWHINQYEEGPFLWK